MRRIRLALAVLLACSMLGAPSTAWAAKAAAAATQVTVHGTVVEVSGPAIGGATVAVSYDNKGTYELVATLTTLADGTWTYAGKKGDYRFDFHAAGADPATVYASYPVNGVFSLTTQLQCYGAIAGTVRDAADATPLAGATVEFFAALPGGGWASAPAASVIAVNGDYTSPQLPTGAYAVKASATDYTAAYYGGATPVAVTAVRAITTSGIDISLVAAPKYATITGRVVRGATATPIIGTYVWFYKQNADGTYPPTTPGWGSPTKTVTTDSAGNYSSGDLLLGTYIVRFWGGSMTGSQWWQYVTDVSLATPVQLTSAGQTVTGIEGWFSKP